MEQTGREDFKAASFHAKLVTLIGLARLVAVS